MTITMKTIDGTTYYGGILRGTTQAASIEALNKRLADREGARVESEAA